MGLVNDRPTSHKEKQKKKNMFPHFLFSQVRPHPFGALQDPPVPHPLNASNAAVAPVGPGRNLTVPFGTLRHLASVADA